MPLRRGWGNGVWMLSRDFSNRLKNGTEGFWWGRIRHDEGLLMATAGQRVGERDSPNSDSSILRFQLVYQLPFQTPRCMCSHLFDMLTPCFQLSGGISGAELWATRLVLSSLPWAPWKILSMWWQHNRGTYLTKSSLLGSVELTVSLFLWMHSWIFKVIVVKPNKSAYIVFVSTLFLY